MATDNFSTYQPGLADPATDAFAITPSDSVDLSVVPRALLIGVAGNVKVTTLGGTSLVLPLPAGYNPIRVTRVWAASLTASGIYGIV